MIAEKQTVLFVAPLNRNLREFEEFERQFNCIFYKLTTRKAFLSDLQTDPKLKKIAGIYCGFSGFHVIGGLEDDEIIDALPYTLKIIAVCSAGFNGYNLTKLRQRGIDFCNTPNYGAPQVAEVALYHIICGFRQFPVFTEALREKKDTIESRLQLQEYTKFDKEKGIYLKITDKQELSEIDPWFAFGEKLSRNRIVTSPLGKVITIVGFGHIGKELGTRVHALGMKVRYVAKHRLLEDEEKRLGYPLEFYEDIRHAAVGSDCMALCLPKTPQTVGILNKEVINSLNDNCCIVNVGRGGLIIEDDLLEGLKSGKVRYAGLDVLEDEPKVKPELLSRQDVCITPHIGSCTEEVFDHTARFCLQNMSCRLDGGVSRSIQN